MMILNIFMRLSRVRREILMLSVLENIYGNQKENELSKAF